MGQYYMIVNEQKKEVITFQYSKAAEIFFNEDDLGRLLMILYYDTSCLGHCFTDLPIPKTNKYIGSWLGTSFVFVGDYAKSRLYDKADDFKDITKPLAQLMLDTFEKLKGEKE